MSKLLTRQFWQAKLVVLLMIVSLIVVPMTAMAFTCGGSSNGQKQESVPTAINFGCEGKGNPIMDFVFAVVRFLSLGVGFVLVGSMIWAGIQYTMSRGDPQATAQAITRIRANVIALLLFIFAYAILNFVIPGQVLR